MNLQLSLFWLIITAMTLLALVFVLLPLVKFRNEQSHRGLKSNWYQTRLNEIEMELASGKFDQAQYDAALTELKLTAKDELQQEQNEQIRGGSSNALSLSWKAGLAGLFVIIVIGFYAWNGHYQKLQDWQNTLEKMPVLSKKVLEGSDAAPTEQELREFSLALRTRLSIEPNAIGWMLLGRNLMMLNDLDGGIDAFDKSFQLDNKNIANLLSLAQSLQQRGEPGDYARSIRLLKAVLSLNPQHLTALILLAEGQLLNDDFESALTGFRLSLRFISEQDPRKGAIQQRITFLENKLNPEAIEVDEAQPKVEKNDITAAGKDTQISIVINFDSALDLAQFDSLFVFAKQPGVPMPLAVKKLSVSDLGTEGQVKVTLSEQDVMVASMSLSNQAEVDIFVTLSVDAAAPFEAGDVQASYKGLSLPAKSAVKLTLAKD